MKHNPDISPRISKNALLSRAGVGLTLSGTLLIICPQAEPPLILIFDISNNFIEINFKIK
ncbi:hypothetical protein DRQ33_07845 [bacterium]|nr:MAG: hypothetical protein DRQ33_07845 [bacterium]